MESPSLIARAMQTSSLHVHHRRSERNSFEFGAPALWRLNEKFGPLLIAATIYFTGFTNLIAEDQPDSPPTKSVAAIVTIYTHNSHADLFASRLLQTDTLDGKGKQMRLKLASVYTDQKPEKDISRMLAASHPFRLSESIEDAITLGTGKLAVDGVLLIAEHGEYPKSPLGQIVWPKRKFWDETLKVFRASGRVVPVFMDKQLAEDWEGSKYVFDSAREMKIPLMAGSSIPVTWRRPAADVRKGARLKEIVGITYHLTEHYGFHALEMIQSLAEQRAGGETGIKSVQTITNDAVWRAFDEKAFDTQLFDAAWLRLSSIHNNGRPFREVARQPKLFRIEYADGLRATLLELNGMAGEWSAAWRYADDGKAESSLFWVQEGRPGMHFTYLMQGIEQMIYSGKPAWNEERTLLTSGILHAMLLSEKEGQQRVETPYLNFHYTPIWRWSQPPPPPVMREWREQ